MDDGALRYYENGHVVPLELVKYRFENGSIDEVRIEDAARPPEWIKLCWENKRPNQALVRYQDLVITAQPVGATVNQGEPHAFTVAAYCAPIVRYQWYKGFDPIPGATSPRLVISDARIEDQAGYYCLVSNSGDSIKSQVAYLEVIETDTTIDHPLVDTDGDGVPDVVERTLGSDEYDPADKPVNLASINNWNNNAAINSRRVYDFSSIPGYEDKDSIRLLIPTGALATDYTILVQLPDELAGIPEPEFKPEYERLGRFAKVTTTLAAGRSALVPIPFPYQGFVPLDFLQVKRWTGTTWEEVKIADITPDAIYIRLMHSSAVGRTRRM